MNYLMDELFYGWKNDWIYGSEDKMDGMIDIQLDDFMDKLLYRRMTLWMVDYIDEWLDGWMTDFM